MIFIVVSFILCDAKTVTNPLLFSFIILFGVNKHNIYRIIEHWYIQEENGFLVQNSPILFLSTIQMYRYRLVKADSFLTYVFLVLA